MTSFTEDHVEEAALRKRLRPEGSELIRRNRAVHRMLVDRVTVVSDGTQTRVGALDAGWEWFKPWRSAVGEQLVGERLPELQVVARGLFHKQYLLGLIRDFIVQAHAKEVLA